MAQQTQKMTSSSKASTTTTSVIRLINVDKTVIKNGDSQTKCAQQEQNEALAVQPHENQIDDSSDGSKAPDTTKIIEMDTDCSRTILVDTKALNRQKELDERYGG